MVENFEGFSILITFKVLVFVRPFPISFAALRLASFEDDTG